MAGFSVHGSGEGEHAPEERLVVGSGGAQVCHGDSVAGVSSPRRGQTASCWSAWRVSMVT